MARLYLFAEGQTEQTFANVLIKPQKNHSPYNQQNYYDCSQRKFSRTHP